jgi:hypothetical protein
MHMGRQIKGTARDNGVPVVTPTNKLAFVIWSRSKWVLWIEGHHLSVAVRTKGNAILEHIRTAIRFGLNMVALKSGVLALMAQAAVSLASNQRLETHIEWKWHS